MKQGSTESLPLQSYRNAIVRYEICNSADPFVCVADISPNREITHIVPKIQNGDNMKKFLQFISIVLLIIPLSACTSNTITYGVNNGDWSYKLPNNYEIWHLNSREIICGKRDVDNSLSNVISENYILEFKYNERYVCLKCVEATRDLSVEIDESNPSFYIIDTIENTIYETYTDTDFEDKIKAMSLVFNTNWIKTTPIPEGAEFE